MLVVSWKWPYKDKVYSEIFDDYTPKKEALKQVFNGPVNLKTLRKDLGLTITISKVKK